MPQRRAAIRMLLLPLALAALPASPADMLRGGELYQKHCGNCHGMGGISTWPGAPNLARREGMLQPDLVLLRKLREGRSTMPAYQGIMTDQDIINVIAFSRTLAR